MERGAELRDPDQHLEQERQGGSLGKGTSLKGGSDADLVVFLSCFKGYSDQETIRAVIIKEIKRMLEKCQQQKQFEVSIKQSRWPNPRVLSFMMSSKMLDESIEGGEFSTCFTELQRDFVVDRRTKVKSLIRLVKYWYKQHIRPYKEYLEAGESLPPSDSRVVGLLQSRRSKRRSLSARGTHRLVPSSVAPVVRLLMGLNQSMGLYQMPAEELDIFITNNLQPNQVFKMQISTAINTIFLFLTQNCFRNSGSAMRVLKVVKAGSSGKGTALKDVSDVDLVVFVSKITDFWALKAERKKIIAEIQTRLEECRGSLGKDLVLSIKKTKWENPRVLTFTLTSNTMGEHIDFDVLPAFDALGQLYRGYKPDPEVYIRLTESDPEGSEFSPCFTELQRNFVMALPTKLKSLIRLVKHWYKQYVLPHKKKLGWEESLPPQYALELLSVYAWERGGRGPAFNMAEGFRTVLELIRQHAQLCVYWTINYGFENETLGWYLKYQLYKSRPIILDPADPTGIVGHGSRWDLVAQEAERCCAQQCCWKRNGSPVQPWNVPLQQTWRAAEGDDFDLQSRTRDKEYPITENQMFANGSHAAEEESYCTLL
ncbi:unnamed protein product [Caretta caretta]